MIKYLFIVINSIVLFIFSLFNGDGGITINGKIPPQIIAGEEVPIELTVNKGSMNGFAKLQLDLPEGFEVKEAEEKGANYSFANGIAKWLWAVLPMESEITIRLTIIAPESDLGIKTIAARYSYVENNVKQSVEMDPIEIKVLAPGSEILAATETKEEPPATGVQPDSATSGKPVVTTSQNEPPGEITSVRKIEKGSNSSEYIISVTINKGITKGFARYSDDLPEGVIVKGAKTDGASFSVADGKIKFVWVSVPDKETLEISYSIGSTSAQKITLKGEYSYLEDNQSKKHELKEETLDFEAAETIAQVPEPAPEKKPEEEKKAETKIVSVEPVKPKKVVKQTTTIEKKEGNMEFLVQVGAFSRIKVTTKRLEKKFNIKESIRSEMMGGYRKFMVGSHAEYKLAREHKSTVVNENGVKSAFVVAYNQGKRITVQEALMISNQKWFK